MRSARFHGDLPAIVTCRAGYGRHPGMDRRESATRLISFVIAVLLCLSPPLAAKDDPFAAFQAAAALDERHFARGDYPQAEEIGRAALDLGRRDLGENAPDVLRLQTRLATVIENQGRRAEALVIMDFPRIDDDQADILAVALLATRIAWPRRSGRQSLSFWTRRAILTGSTRPIGRHS